MSLPNIQVSLYVPLINPEQIVQCLKERDMDYLEYLLGSQYSINFPSQPARDFDFTKDRSGMIFVYLSNSPFREYLRKLCTVIGLEFDEV